MGRGRWISAGGGHGAGNTSYRGQLRGFRVVCYAVAFCLGNGINPGAMLLPLWVRFMGRKPFSKSSIVAIQLHSTTYLFYRVSSLIAGFCQDLKNGLIDV